DEAGRRCQDLRAEPRRVPAAGPRVRRSPRCPGRPHQAAAAPGQHAPVRRDAVRRAGPVGGGRGLRGDPWRRLPAPRGRLADLGDRGDEGRCEVLPGLVEPDLGPVRGAGQGLRGDRCRGGRAAVQRPRSPAGQRWLRGPGGLGRRLGLRGRLGLRLTARDGEAGRWRLRGPGLRAGLVSGRAWVPGGPGFRAEPGPGLTWSPRNRCPAWPGPRGTAARGWPGPAETPFRGLPSRNPRWNHVGPRSLRGRGSVRASGLSSPAPSRSPQGIGTVWTVQAVPFQRATNGLTTGSPFTR